MTNNRNNSQPAYFGWDAGHMLSNNNILSKGTRRRIIAALRQSSIYVVFGRQCSIGALGCVSSGKSGFALSSALGTLLALGLTAPVSATTLPAPTVCVSSAGGVVANEPNQGGTTGQPVDGSDTYSTVAGCSANGNNQLAVTVFGAHTEASGSGAVVVGYNASAVKWASAFGLNANAAATGSVALGFSAVSTGVNAVAIGSAGGDGTTPLSASNSTIASGAYSIALGANDVRGAQASGANSMAMGGEATAVGDGSIAQGLGATANEDDDIAIGTGATATGNAAGSALAIGAGNSANGAGAMAGGLDSTATGDGTVAFGNMANAGGGGQAVGVPGTPAQGAVSIGYQTTAGGNGAVAIGNRAQATHSSALALGNQAEATATWTIAIGEKAQATAEQAQAFGDYSTASGNSSVALGTFATATGDTAMALGGSSSATADGAIAIGITAAAEGVNAASIGGAAYNKNSTAIGNNAIAGISGSATVMSDTAVGHAALATGGSSSAFGDESSATGLRSLAAGVNASAAGTSAVSVGDNASAPGADGIAIGRNALASGVRSLAQGVGAIAGAYDSIAIGTGASATAGEPFQGVTAVGKAAIAFGPNSSAYGADSEAIGGGTALGAGSRTENGGLAIGTRANAGTGFAHPIVGLMNNNVAIGDDSRVADGANFSVALGTLSYAGDANLSAAAYNPGVGPIAGTNVIGEVSVGSASEGAYRRITNLAAGAADTDAVNVSQLQALADTVDAGWNVTAQGANGTNVSVASATGNSVDLNNTDGNIEVTKAADSNDVTFGLAADLVIDNSITVGDTIINGDSVTTTDLTVTGDTQLGDNFAVNDGGVYYDGPVTEGNHIVNKQYVDNSVTTAVSNVNIGFAGNSGDTVVRTSGQVLTIQGEGTTAGTYSGGNIRTETDPATGAVNIQLADSPTFGNVTVNADGTGKITGVTDATLSSTSTEAVNGSQLVALGDSIASSLSPGSTYDPTTNAINTQIVVGGDVYNNVESAIQAVSNSAAAGWNVTTASTGSGVSTGSSVANVAPDATATFTAGNNMAIHQNGTEVQVALNPSLTEIESIAITGGPTINGDGIDMGGDRITNLAPGVGPMDAVNMGQFNAGLSNTLNQANIYTDNAIADVRFDLTQFRRDANGGTASAMAMGTLPQAFEPGMGIMGFGVAHWQGQQAFAVGFSKASDDGRVVMRASGTYNTRSQAGAAVGVGIQF